MHNRFKENVKQLQRHSSNNPTSWY